MHLKVLTVHSYTRACSRKITREKAFICYTSRSASSHSCGTTTNWTRIRWMDLCRWTTSWGTFICD